MAVNITQELGPQIVLKSSENFTLNVGIKSSAQFNQSNSASIVISGENVEITAAETLPAYRAVMFNGLLCDPIYNDLSQYAGVTIGGIALGQTGFIMRTGLLFDGAFTWTPDAPVFIDTDGVLTQTPPANPPLRRIGWAFSVTSINLDPFPVIGV